MLIIFVTAHVYNDARNERTEREPGCLMYLGVISIADQKSRDQCQTYVCVLIGSFMFHRTFLQCKH